MSDENRAVADSPPSGKGTSGTKSQRVNARLDDGRAAKLTALCAETGASVTEVLQEAIDVLYNQHRNQDRAPSGILARTGFIACAEGPEDLSENVKAELGRTLERKHGDG